VSCPVAKGSYPVGVSKWKHVNAIESTGGVTDWYAQDGDSNSTTIPDGATLEFNALDWYGGLNVTLTPSTNTFQFKLDLYNMYPLTAPDPDDQLVIYDASAALHKKVGWSQLVPSTRSIVTTDGIMGGGTLASDPTLKLDISTLSAKATPVAGDELVIYDSIAGNIHKRVDWSKIVPSTRTISTGTLQNTGLSGGGNLTSNLNLKVDINALVDGGTPNENDWIMVLNNGFLPGSENYYKYQLSDLPAAPGTGSMDDWVAAADTGSDTTISDAEVLNFTGGTSINTVVAGGTPNTLTISTSQAIDTTSGPQFANLGLGAAALSYSGLNLDFDFSTASASASQMYLHGTITYSGLNNTLFGIRSDPSFTNNGQPGSTAYGTYLDQPTMDGTNPWGTATTLHIVGAPTGGDVTTRRALHVAGGESEFDGAVDMDSTLSVADTATMAAATFSGTITASSLGTDAGNFITNVGGVLNERTASQAKGDMGLGTSDSVEFDRIGINNAADVDDRLKINAAGTYTGTGQVPTAINIGGITTHSSDTPGGMKGINSNVDFTYAGDTSITVWHAYFGAPNLVNSGIGDFANAYNVYIEGSTTGDTPTGVSRSLYVAAGNSYFGGSVGIAPASKLYFDNYSDTYIYESAADVVDLVLGGTQAVRFAENAGKISMLMGDTTNVNNTQGLTLNQLAGDDEIISLKSSDVSHGMTSITEADTYFYAKKIHGSYGGAWLRGFSDHASQPGMRIWAITGSESPSVAGMTLGAGKLKTVGATAQKYENSELVMSIDNYTTPMISLYADSITIAQDMTTAGITSVGAFDHTGDFTIDGSIYFDTNDHQIYLDHDGERRLIDITLNSVFEYALEGYQDDIRFVDGDDNTAIYMAAGGLVAIGTNTIPTEALEVAGNITATGSFQTTKTGLGVEVISGTNAYMSAEMTTTGAGWAGYRAASTVGAWGFIVGGSTHTYVPGYLGLYHFDTSSYRLIIDGSGNVNITTGQLQFNGTQINSSNLSDVASIAMLDENETVTGDWAITGTATLTAPYLNNPVLSLPKIWDDTVTFTYTIGSEGELAANRTIDLPLLIGDDTFVTEQHIQTMTNKTLTSPTIGDFTYAGHTHADTGNGGVIDHAPITASGTGGMIIITDGSNLQISAVDSSAVLQGAGTTNYNTYWTSVNTFGSEQYVATSRGGTGGTSAAATGIAQVIAGSWEYDYSIAAETEFVLGIRMGDTQAIENLSHEDILVFPDGGSFWSPVGVSMGIGTGASPSSTLEISSTSTTKTALHIDNTTVGGIRWDIASVGSGIAGRIGNLQIRNDTAGTNHVEITPTGNVGIGTTAPGNHMLNIAGVGSANTGVLAIDASAVGSQYVWASSSLAPSLSGDQQVLHMMGVAESSNNAGYIGFNYTGGTGSASNFLTFGLFGSNNLMNLTGAGNLGIGSTTVGQRLHVYHATDNNLVKFESGDDIATLWMRDNDSSGYLGQSNGYTWIGSSGALATTNLNVKSTGQVGMGTTGPAHALEVAGSGHHIALTDSGDTYDSRVLLGHADGSGGYIQALNDSSVVQVMFRSYGDSYIKGGDLGIGTTTPGYTLDVVGSINASVGITVAGTSVSLVGHTHTEDEVIFDSGSEGNLLKDLGASGIGTTSIAENWFNQAVTTTSSPTFTGATLNGTVTVKPSSGSFWVRTDNALEGIELTIPDHTLNNNDMQLAFWENANKLYGARFYYDGGTNLFEFWMHNNDAGTKVYDINRSTLVFDFKSTPTVSGTAVSLVGHTHSYDNYASWTLGMNESSSSAAIASGATANFTAGNGLTNTWTDASPHYMITTTLTTPATNLGHDTSNTVNSNGHTHAIENGLLSGTTNQITVSDSAYVLKQAVTLSLPQNIHTGATPTFAGGAFTGDITVTDAAGAGTGAWNNGTIIQTWVGDSDSIVLRNINVGDYWFGNSEQGNGIFFYDGTGGVDITYNGTSVLEVGSAGTTILNSLEVSNDADAGLQITSSNINTGTSAYASLRLETSSGSVYFMSHAPARTATRYDSEAVGDYAEILAQEVSGLLLGTGSTDSEIIIGTNSLKIIRARSGGISLFKDTYVTGTLDVSSNITVSGTVDGIDIAGHDSAATGVHGVGAGAIVGTTLTQTLTNKTLSTPAINDFSSATHDHSDDTDGGTLDYDTLNNLPDFYSVSGTSNQVTVTGAGKVEGEAITLSLPQNINTGATPTFNSINIGGTAWLLKQTSATNRGLWWDNVNLRWYFLENGGGQFYIDNGGDVWANGAIDANGHITNGGRIYTKGGTAFYTVLDAGLNTAERTWSWPDASGTFASQEWVTAQNYITEAEDNQTLSWVASTGVMTISGTGNSVDTGLGTADNVTMSGNWTFDSGELYLGSGSVSRIRSDNVMNLLTSGGSAQTMNFKSIQVSSSYSGTPPADGILFGTDTNLYRSAADTLKTQDNFIVQGTYSLAGAMTSTYSSGDSIQITAASAGMRVTASLTTAWAGYRATNTSGDAWLGIYANGSAYAGTWLGQTQADATRLYSANASALLIGTNDAAPVYIGTADTWAMYILTNQRTQFSQNMTLDKDLNMTTGTLTISGGSIVVSGTVDGVDVAQLKSDFDTHSGLTNAHIDWTNATQDFLTTGTLTAAEKHFQIDHPDPTKSGLKSLNHGSLEGPENGVYVRGTVEGNVIILPDYWKHLVHTNKVTCTLTPQGSGQDPYVDRITDEKIYLGNNKDTPIHVHYVIYGERKDVEKLQVEQRYNA
jgi:hypothetical protein